MEQLLLDIRTAGYVIIGLLIVQITIYFAVTSEHGTFARLLPKINNYAKRGVYELKVKLQKTRKVKNLGGNVETAPEVSIELERWFARELLKKLETKMFDEVSLSVATWVKSGEWRGTQKQFTALMDKWTVERIVCKINDRGDRGFAQPYRSITAKLKVKVK